jgi:CxxC motif-containing protein
MEVVGQGPEDLVVVGNRCKRGLAYAKEELFAPKRLVTSTLRIVPEFLPDSEQWDLPRRLPCRTRSAFPRELIPELLEIIRTIEVVLPIKSGDLIRCDLLGTGVDLIATRSLP